MRYNAEDAAKPAGRLLIYCDDCRQQRGQQLGTLLPIAVLDQDPGGVLTHLYQGGATLSDTAHGR